VFVATWLATELPSAVRDLIRATGVGNPTADLLALSRMEPDQ
jgi:hypothetical protein